MSESARLKALVGEIVRLPVAADERFFNDDLAGLDDEALRREQGRLRVAMLLMPSEDHWLLERVAAIAREIGRRRGR